MSESPQRSVGKLFDLKAWVELPEAAQALTILTGEDVHSDDVLRLGLDGHLTLSVRFLTATPARCGTTILLADAPRHTFPNLDGDGIIVSIEGTVVPGQDRVIAYDKGIKRLFDVWDLPMFGGERLEAENLYEQSKLRGCPELFNLEGTFVTDSNGIYCQLLQRFDGSELGGKLKLKHPPDHPDNFYPAAGLPEDSVVVVRTDALRAFAARLAEEKSENASRPLGSRERNTLLTMIAALAKLAKVDISRPSAAAGAIESETVRLGARVAARTIENHLKRVPDALEDRGE